MKLQNTAAVLAALTGGDKPRIEPALGLILPLIPALFLELGSILFLGIGLGQDGQPKAKPEKVPPAIPRRRASRQLPGVRALQLIHEEQLTAVFRSTNGGQRTTKAEAEAQIINLLRFRKGKPPTQGELARLWKVDQSTVSRWYADWNRRGITNHQRAVG